MAKEKSSYSKLNDLIEEIYNDHEHGEYLYQEEMLNDFISNLDKAKELAKKVYEVNKYRMEGE